MLERVQYHVLENNREDIFGPESRFEKCSFEQFESGPELHFDMRL